MLWGHPFRGMGEGGVTSRTSLEFGACNFARERGFGEWLAALWQVVLLVEPCKCAEPMLSMGFME